MKENLNLRLVPDYADGLKRTKPMNKLSFGKRKVILSEEELKKLEDLYHDYIEKYGIELGFVNYLLKSFRGDL